MNNSFCKTLAVYHATEAQEVICVSNCGQRLTQGVAKAELTHNDRPLELDEQVFAVAAHNGEEHCAVRAASGDAEVLYEDELAEDKEAEEETPVEAPKEGGAKEDDPIGEGGEDGASRFDDIAGRLVHCDRGGEATGIS